MPDAPFGFAPATIDPNTIDYSQFIRPGVIPWGSWGRRAIDFLTPEWSKPFAGMSAEQANNEARILSDPNANPARVGKIGPGYLSDTDRLGAAALDVGSMVAPELKGAAALKGVLAATKTLPPIGPELGSGLRAARQMTDLSNSAISAPITPLRSFELPKYVEPTAPANMNAPKSGLQWQSAQRYDQHGPPESYYKFITDQNGRTLGDLIPDWNWDDATETGRYTYRPRLVIHGPQGETALGNKAMFDNQADAQQYVERMLAGGDFSKEAHDRVLAELAPQIEARQREEAAQAARGKFSVVPPDSQPLLRDVTARGRSGRPIASEPLPIGTEGEILEQGAGKATDPFYEGKNTISYALNNMFSGRIRSAPISVPEGGAGIRAEWNPSTKQLNIDNIDFERKGTGAFSSYLDHIENLSRENGAKSVRVESILNDRLIPFLEERGYTIERSAQGHPNAVKELPSAGEVARSPTGKYYISDFFDNEYHGGRRFNTAREAREAAKSIPANENGVFIGRDDGDYLHTVSDAIDENPKGYVHDVVPPRGSTPRKPFGSFAPQ